MKDTVNSSLNLVYDNIACATDDETEMTYDSYCTFIWLLPHRLTRLN